MGPTELLLMYFAMPLWFLAGIADWVCHRRSHLRATSGLFESALHLLMFAEAGVALIIGLFCEINALVFLVFITLFLCHEATSLWDIRYAIARREVTFWEQHVHSFLEITPLLALTLLATMHWPQVSALFTFSEDADWSLRGKSAPLPIRLVVSVLAAAFFLELAPYAEELWSGLRRRGP
jgi:hypothetical protein